MNLLNEVRSLGGAARTVQLHERGHSKHVIAAAVSQQMLVRPRRGWVALRGLDQELLLAATHGAVLSCVSLARRKGLWVAETPTRPHLAVRSRAMHVSAPAELHWARPLVPRDPDSLVDSLSNMLDLVANCLPREHALAIWESALNKKLTDLQALGQLPFSNSAKRVLEQCTPFSDSGLETLFRTRLRWLGVSIRAQTWTHGHRVDFLIDSRLVVQIDGKQHGGEQKVSDYRHDIELILRGYHVIRVAYTDVMYDWPAVQDSIMQAIARGLHLAKAA